ncbi:cytokinin dehydrogenase 11 [Hordeum vulgare]|nr:cytokinin dehydrogenase 11 [Hordeum vulgare]
MHAIVHTTHLTMAVHGNDHLVARQAMSDGGLVLDMRASAASRCQQMKLVSSCGGAASAGVPGSALWEEVSNVVELEVVTGKEEEEGCSSGDDHRSLTAVGAGWDPTKAI